jgi:hypothetical protein
MLIEWICMGRSIVLIFVVFIDNIYVDEICLIINLSLLTLG